MPNLKIKDLDPKESATKDDIPIKILKLNANFLSFFLSKVFNESIKYANLSDYLDQQIYLQFITRKITGKAKLTTGL